MKVLYIECNMGAAGDMLMGALLELLEESKQETFIRKMNHLGIPGVHIHREKTTKCGIMGTHMQVHIHGEEEGEHHHHKHDGDEHHVAHTGMNEIKALINHLDVSEQVKGNVISVYNLIAQAESKAHGKTVDMVHFHEVGMMDAVADILGVCLLIEELAPERIIVSPVHVGSGQVTCAHGILPVPAPATAFIFSGVPTYGGEIKGELCTPTGAALLKHFADEFGNRPIMVTDTIGYGMGKKDFPAANCVRVFLGSCERKEEDIMEISCNLDDMTGEEIGYAFEVLLENGALDVYISPIQMKKNRPGQRFVCLCKIQDEEKLSELILRHTTTFGVRIQTLRRRTLERKVRPLDTKWGDMRMKTGKGYGVEKEKIEYEDLARVAREHQIPISEVKSKM